MVNVGDIVCQHCGTNLKSGESFESRVKRQKSKARHAEQFADTMLVGGAFVFGLVLLTCFIIQSRAINVMEEDPRGLRPVVLGIELVDQLTAIAQDPDLTQEEKVERGIDLMEDTRYDAYRPIFAEAVAPQQEMQAKDINATIEDGPGPYARALASELIRGIGFRQKDIEDMEQGSTEMAVRRRNSTYGKDFNLGAYRRFLDSLKKRLQLQVEALEDTAA
jgi:hypothetical protein